MRGFISFIVAGFGLGWIPKAPGTFGSLLGIPLAYVMHEIAVKHGHYFSFLSNETSAYPAMTGKWFALAIMGCVITMISWWFINKHESFTSDHDQASTVIDEVVGQSLALMWFQPNWWIYILGFSLFRLLDISKPGPIGWADRELPGASGTLLDDVIAGLGAGALLGVYCLLVGNAL